MNLNRLQEMVDTLNQSNSNNEKKESLKNFSDMKPILWWVYNPYKQFHITSANLEKRKDLIDDAWKDVNLELLLQNLSDEKITGHSALSAVNGFISGHIEHKDLIYKIIDKNLETRVDTKSINKVFPNLIPEFSVALANTFDDKIAEKIDFEKETYYASHKLDGVRCIARKEGNEVKFLSRNGKEFLTLDKIRDELLSIFEGQDIVLDGEICLVDENGNEDFQSVMKEIRKKNSTIQNPLFNVFDFLTLEEFDNKESTRNLVQRAEDHRSNLQSASYIKVIDQIEIVNQDHLATLSEKAESLGWEGLILRKNTTYKGKRSNDLLKVKKFHDAEYVVEDVESGLIRWINEEGKEVEEEMLSRVFINHKGYRVRVGSGFSMEQRRAFYADPSLILGKTITVKYFQESQNQSGNLSLRFPTIKTIHGLEREV